MKNLDLNASPKRDASDTMHITHAFLEGMLDVSEHEVRTEICSPMIPEETYVSIVNGAMG